MSAKNEFDPYDFLSGVAFAPNLIGPTLSSISPFTLPTGPTGLMGPTGSSPQSAFRAVNTYF
ncbi:exosporium leader peptide-containing protein [Bacillus thuringiensis]|uniref:exosporium leader peptide-containing protein n=1 Tax=Bacillus thuringiensis TaxID=1428 RepID=UPI000BF4C176|nr:exosporium leader peptide-containing protein [Bacillus thuringiensis]PFA08038.1 hypothetical protein CN379_09750 [Bacillus thuringiensis]